MTRRSEPAILETTTRLVPVPVLMLEQWLQWRRENPVSPRKRPLERLLLLMGARRAGRSALLVMSWVVGVPILSATHNVPLDA